MTAIAQAADEELKGEDRVRVRSGNGSSRVKR